MMKRNLITSALVFLLVLALLTVPAAADNGEVKGVFHGPPGHWNFADNDWELEISRQFGQAEDIPVFYDGKAGVFRPEGGHWIFAEDEDWTPTPFDNRPQFGQVEDIPIVVDGQPGVFRPQGGHWIFADADWNPVIPPDEPRPQFGQEGDIPIVVDGKPGVFRPAGGIWIFAEDEDWTPTPPEERRQFGQAGDIPIVVDGTPGVYRDGTWIFADEEWNPTPFGERPEFGEAGDWPFAGIITPPPPEPTVITTIVPIDNSVDVPYGTSLEDVIAALAAETAYEGVVENPGTVPVDIEDWASATYDPEAEGDHTFTGQAIAPEGYVFADGVDAEVSAIVTVGDRPEDKPVTQVNPQSTYVDRDTPKEDIDFPATATARAGTTWYSLDVEWDDESTPAYNGFIPGDYVFEGDLINLPSYVTNPDNLKAVFTVTVEDTVYDETEFVSTYQQFQAAIDNKPDRIILEADITLEGRERIEYDLKMLDLRGFTITLADGPLAFLGDDTTVRNGKIVGDVTWWPLDCSEVDDVWKTKPWQNWQHENKVMISGKGITFDNIVFEVDVADWYQTQSDRTYGTTSGLTIRNSALYGVSLFNSDVYITRTDVYNRVGIEHNDALLNEVEYKVNNKLIVYKGSDSPTNTKQYEGYYDLQPSVGIVYVNSDATLLNNKWNAGRTALDVVIIALEKGEWVEQELVKDVTVDYDYATGMFVGKSLKYYGTYSHAEPRLNGAIVDSDKYAFVWWALNYDKARLWTAGEIVVISQEGRGGLMVVGTDARDYPKIYTGEPTFQTAKSTEPDRPRPRPGTEFEGGQIVGTGTFTGAAVYIGKPTEGYAKFAGYPGAATLDIDSKDPWCINRTGYEEFEVDIYIRDVKKGTVTVETIIVPKGIWDDDYMLDCQACKKDADRLYIHGQTFISPVYIFTPANDYIGCDGDCVCPCCGYEQDSSDFAYLKDPVWFGDLTFGKIQLWGDFDIIRTKTVTFDEIKVMCGNIRRIGTEKDIWGTHEDCIGWPDFTEGGTLTGGTIISDTKKDNVLVLGDGLKVYDVELHSTLYNVILESAWLESVRMNVGQGNKYDDRWVCEHICGGDGKYLTKLEGDIFVWPENIATISNSMFSGQTRIVVKDNAALTLANDVDNRGTLIFEPEAGLYFDNADFDWVDIRDAITVDIRQSGGRTYIDIEFSPFSAYWRFENWKLDAEFTADDRIISKKYKISWYPQAAKVDPPWETRWFNWYIDYRDPEEYEWSILEGAYLIGDMLGVGHKEYLPFPEPGPKLEEQDTITIRLEAGAPELPGDEVTFVLSGRLVGINCCTRELIEFETATKEITLIPKFACKDFNLRQAFMELEHPTFPLDLWHEDIPWLPGWDWHTPTQYNGWIVFPKEWIDE